jgi:hypothetical protein
MVWLKTRTTDGHNTSTDREWVVMHKDGGDPRIPEKLGFWYSALDKDTEFKRLTLMSDATPEQITIHTAKKVNAVGNTYIAYLFASVPGISKVGSYTGDGQLRVIDCGFDDSGQSTIGLLVKRTDANGDWAWHYTWTSGAYLAGRLHLNEASAGAKQNDLGAGFGGFQLQPTSPYNIDGAKYIYYAIAE